jgi:hypothetical protein
MDVPENLLKKMVIVCFFQFSFVFSALRVEKITDNLMLWCWAFDFSLKLKESVLKIRVNLILQCFEVLLTCLWAMEKLMASAFNNLTDFLLPYNIVLLSSSLPTNQRLYNFLAIIYHIVNQPSYPSLAGLTVDWLEYEIFVTSWDIGFQVIVAPLFQIQQP